jgi:hypothetical protein
LAIIKNKKYLEIELIQVQVILLQLEPEQKDQDQQLIHKMVIISLLLNLKNRVLDKKLMFNDFYMLLFDRQLLKLYISIIIYGKK